MAHELSIRKDGTVEMAWAGERPWHGLGVQIPDRMTALNALTAASLEWEVEKRALYYGPHAEAEKYAEVPDHFATVRGDTGAYLGTVGSSYVPLQNAEQAAFIDALVQGGAVVETVGAIYGGARTFWACKIPGDMLIKSDIPEDRLEQYLTLFNGHDGSMAFRAFWTKVRVVCNNTWMAAARGEGFKQGFSIRHTANVQARVKKAQEVLGLIHKASEDELASLNHLAACEVKSEAEIVKFLDEIFGKPEKDATERTVNRLVEVKGLVRENIFTERAQLRPGSTGLSRWDVFNAVTYYGNHQLRTRGTKTSGSEPERRLNSVLLGQGNELAETALSVLLS